MKVKYVGDPRKGGTAEGSAERYADQPVVDVASKKDPERVYRFELGQSVDVEDADAQQFEDHSHFEVSASGGAKKKK